LRQKNSAKGYIRLMKSRRTDGLWSLADKIEDRAWKAPDSATDKLNPYGVPYYINMADAAVTTGGFIGHLIRYAGGTTGTVCAGIDAAVEAKWNNYADVYVKVDNMLLRKLKKAMLLTRFRPPVFIDSPGKDQPGKKRMYVNADAAVELMDLADKRDDASSPKDLAGKALIDVQGTTSFNRIPIVYIPQLDGAAYSPIYTVDFSKFIPVVQEGYWMNEGKPISGGRLQHTTVTVFLDGSHNNLCLNRRTAGFVLHTVTA
ncbi:MAG: hypothetical protein IMZ50_10830, partial [Candidatus Atribacteria bacterium]|nr:hypothetical protein [Candidatus Atribacteria bacterium]